MADIMVKVKVVGSLEDANDFEFGELYIDEDSELTLPVILNQLE